MQRLKLQTERIERWREAFCDDTTGIHKMVQDLLWNYAAFQTTAQIVRLANELQDGEYPINQMLFNLIREGYWTSLTLGTRRLLDKGPLKGSKGVYSIRSVVKDVKACHHRLNREKYVEMVHHTEYDTQNLLREMDKELAATNGPVWGNPEIMKSNYAHQCFDELSGVAPPDRSRDDLIDLVIFDKIEARLVALESITDHVDTHVAHAGNMESRVNKTLGDFDIQNARDTVRQLKEVASLIGRWFANEGSAGLSTFIGDQFENLDQPLVRSSELEKLEKQWEALDQEIENWSIDIKEL